MVQGSLTKSPTKTPKIKPLQAKLFFELPKPLMTPEPKNKPPKKTIELPKEETVQVNPAKQDVKPKPTKPEKQKPNKIEQTKALTSDPKEQTNEQPKPTPVPSIDKTSVARPQVNSQFTGLAGKHVQALNQQADKRLAQEAGRYYQQQKNSPIIHAPNKNRFMTEDEKRLDKTKIRANCDGAARKTAAIIMGFMGGNVDCTSKPNINNFINKRINKEATLPDKYERPLDKIPKSVVIKN